jgi:lipoyl(octanoyl) transferase
MNPKVIYQNLGRISYHKAWDYQSQLQKQLIEKKLAARKLETISNTESSGFEKPISCDTVPPKPVFEQTHYLLFCEHNPVYTLGKSGSINHLLLDEVSLTEKGIEFFKINRGGDITYHGPGQITGYPIFDLDFFFTDVHKYVRYLEEAIIRTLADYGLAGMRIKEFTGVWLEGDGNKPKRKICAIGVHLSRWVTLHGFAFNVNTDLNYFKNIIPCGIEDEDKTVTSLAMELGRQIDVEEVKDKLKEHFAQLFGFEFV